MLLHISSYIKTTFSYLHCHFQTCRGPELANVKKVSIAALKSQRIIQSLFLVHKLWTDIFAPFKELEGAKHWTFGLRLQNMFKKRFFDKRVILHSFFHPLFNAKPSPTAIWTHCLNKTGLPSLDRRQPRSHFLEQGNSQLELKFNYLRTK
jgi:hypothetical protein